MDGSEIDLEGLDGMRAFGGNHGGLLAAGAAALSLTMAPATVAAPATGNPQSQVHDAYAFAFPLYYLSQLRWTALHSKGERVSTELNRFAHSRAIAGPEDHWANGPLVDSLYSTAWIDLARGPAWVATPDTHGRYYVLTLIDFWSNTFFYAGHSTTGTAAQRYLLVGPGWKGAAPPGAKVLRAATNDVYVNLRVLVDGPGDLAAAHTVQDGFAIRFAAPQPKPGKPRRDPNPDGPESFIAVTSQMLALDPPPERDAALAASFRGVGICASGCSWRGLSQSVRQAWRAAWPKLIAAPTARYRARGLAHGWIDYNPPGSKLGTPDMDYHLRAFALATGKGMLGLRREEADYWMTLTDAHGQPLVGGKSYRLRLPPSGIPAKAYWSIALYQLEPDGEYLSPNKWGRYHLGDRTGVKADADGSIDITISPEPPTTGESNWLPTPAPGMRFQLFARAYEPGPEVLAGKFVMPPVEDLP